MDIKTLVKELFEMNEMHEKYQDNDISLSIDSEMQDNNTIVITIKRDDDKKRFENWVQEIDDDIYEEVIELLTKKLPNMNEIYESSDYKKVIELFKSTYKSIIKNKIQHLQSLIGV